MSDNLRRLFIPGIIDAILPTVEWVQEFLGGKVDKVAGKGLSTNDYTTAEKEKLSGIAAGAEVNAVTSVNGKTGVVTIGASDVGALPSSTVIPPTVTEQTVSGWGFTKNTGMYSKPSGGIPKNDLASDVKTSLGKADTALQEHQSLSGLASEAWVQNKGYQSAQDVSLAIRAADAPFELIKTHTVDGTEGASFSINTDDGGNAFRLKKLVMRVTLGTVSAADRVAANVKSGGKTLAQAYSSYTASASGQKYKLIVKQDSGYWTMAQYPCSNLTASVSVTHTFCYTDAVADYPYIDSVQITRELPEGTVIEILSVPYDSTGIQSAESNSFGGGA